MYGGGCRPAEPFPLLARMCQASSCSFAQDLSFELRKDGQQAGHRSTGGCGQIQRLRQGNETHSEVLQFLKSRQQIGNRAAPAVQPPDQHDIDLPSPSGLQQFLAGAAPEVNSRACKAIVQPRRIAYSRMARFCIASVCWSLVETRAYRPARNIFPGLRTWPKTSSGFAFREARLAAISECHLTMAAVDLFRPDRIHHITYAAVVEASRASVSGAG